MSLVKENFILEFNNSFSSKNLDDKPVFDGGYVFGSNGNFHRKIFEEKENEDYYLEIKCSSLLNATGSKLLKKNQIDTAIQDENSFSFFIKNYSNENKSSLFRGDLNIFQISNAGSNFDNQLVRNSKEEYTLKVSNGTISETPYLENDEDGEKTFYIKLSENQGQKIFGMNVEYSNEVFEMSPVIVNNAAPNLPLRRNTDGAWGEGDSFSVFVPISIVDLDSKSTTNLFDIDITAGQGGSSSLGLNGMSGPIFD